MREREVCLVGKQVLLCWAPQINCHLKCGTNWVNYVVSHWSMQIQHSRLMDHVVDEAEGRGPDVMVSSC